MPGLRRHFRALVHERTHARQHNRPTTATCYAAHEVDAFVQKSTYLIRIVHLANVEQSMAAWEHSFCQVETARHLAQVLRHRVPRFS